MRPTLFTRLRGAADPVARRFGYYSAYELDGEQIGTVSARPIVTKQLLGLKGYEQNRLSAAKRHPESGELHHYSLRRVDPEDPQRQYHVHLWPVEDDTSRTEVHSHRELRPDLSPVGSESWPEAYERMRRHYRPGDTYEPQAADSVARKVLDVPR